MEKMNKEIFVQTLKEKLNIEESQINIINNILESNNIIGKNNKEKIINDLMEQLNIDNEKANEIYETSMNVLASSIKDKLKHPFKSVD